MDLSWLSLLGWAASIIVTISLLMKDAKKLRAWNLVGATLFVIYCSIRGDWPIVMVNAIIWCANVYYLYQYYVVEPRQARLERTQEQTEVAQEQPQEQKSEPAVA